MFQTRNTYESPYLFAQLHPILAGEIVRSELDYQTLSTGGVANWIFLPSSNAMYIISNFSRSDALLMLPTIFRSVNNNNNNNTNIIT